MYKEHIYLIIAETIYNFNITTSYSLVPIRLDKYSKHLGLYSDTHQLALL